MMTTQDRTPKMQSKYFVEVFTIALLYYCILQDKYWYKSKFMQNCLIYVQIIQVQVDDLSDSYLSFDESLQWPKEFMENIVPILK